jgi:RNA polymerase sigma factor (sigma-70 family)
MQSSARFRLPRLAFRRSLNEIKIFVNDSDRLLVYTIEEHMSTAIMDKPTADNAQEFESLFREHYLLVYRTACVITGNQEDAEDVLQTIFLRLMRRSTPPDIRKNPKGYFYKAAVHLSLDTISSRRREVLTSDFTAIEGQTGTEAFSVQGVLDKRLVATLAKLKPRSVEMVMLRYVHDYTEPEIAKLLGVSRGTVAVTLFRARMRLRKLLRASSLRGEI